MVHGYADLVYDHQGGPRGGDKTFSESMLMVMAQHTPGPGTLTLRAMLSLDPAMGAAAIRCCCRPARPPTACTPLVDRQHPHDLFMELAGVYSLPVGDGCVGLPLCRLSGRAGAGAADLHAPLLRHGRPGGADHPSLAGFHPHHLWRGHRRLRARPFKIEGSAFNGREPDQFRWDFDPPRLDSYSGRLSLNPDRRTGRSRSATASSRAPSS